MKQETVPSYAKYYLPLLISGITALVYYPSLHYGFQFDDIANITKHFNIRHHTLSSLFFSGSRWISYWLNAIHYSIGKFDPFSYRVGNVLIHITNGMLVFCILYLALSRIKQHSFFRRNHLSIALFSALLFLLHPVQTQTVSYVIQGELEGLAALFTLSTLACFLLSTYSAARSLMYIVGIRAALYFLAFMSCGTKEITIVLPFLLLLVDWFFVAQGSTKDLWSRKWLHASISCCIFATYLFLLRPSFFYELFGLKMAVKNNIGNVITHNPLSMITPGAYFISQFKVILHYLTIFIWPFNISVEYDWVLSRSFFSPDCLIPFAILSCMALGVVYLLKKSPTHPICFGFLWFAICIAPRSSIIPSPELVADYKTYLSSVGWLFLFAIALVACIEYSASLAMRRTHHLLYTHGAVALLCTLPLGYATMQRNTVWSSGARFWQNVILNAPGKARAYNNYGVELSQEEGKYEESIPYFQKAIAMDPNYPDPCNNLAVAYARVNNIPKAIEAILQSLKLNPHYPEGYNNLASFYLDQKDYVGAQQALERAINLRSHYGKAYFNLGRVYSAQGNEEKAWEYYKKCCTQADLDTEIGFYVYAQSSFRLQKYDDAVLGFRRTLEINPNNNGALFDLGNTYFLKNEFKQALNCYLEGLKRDPNDFRVTYNLGEVYIRLNEIEKALPCFEKIRHISQVPNAAIRLAECYLNVGNAEQAKNVLLQACNSSLPESTKLAAHELLKKVTA